MSSNLSRHWMELALLEAKKALKNDEVPVGAIVVKDNKIIGRGFNQVIKTSDPTAHAEIVALREASKHESNYRLLNCCIYVTLEPCMMCLGAIIHARITELHFATKEPKAGVICSHGPLYTMPFLNHRLSVKNGILRNESQFLLKNFFKQKKIRRK